jgi:hypothetical protein
MAVGQRLFGDLVAGGFAAGAAVVEAVFVQADVELSLAEDAVLFALAAFFDLVTLVAADFGFGGHGETLAPAMLAGKVPLVTRGRALGFGLRALGSRL